MGEIKANYKEVANLLKNIVNDNCVDGFKWFPEATRPVNITVFDLTMAIQVLDNTEDTTIAILDE